MNISEKEKELQRVIDEALEKFTPEQRASYFLLKKLLEGAIIKPKGKEL